MDNHLHNLYSRWPLLDELSKEAQLKDMKGRSQCAYQFLMQSYGCKGYLAQEKDHLVEQIRQSGQYLQSQKMQAD